MRNLNSLASHHAPCVAVAPVLVLVASAGFAQSTDVIVTRLPRNQAEVSIDVNPVNPSHVVVMGNSHDNQMQFNSTYSLDGGQTWQVVGLGRAYPTCDDTGAKGDCIGGFRSDPTLAFDANGRLYVGYSDLGADVLVVCRSADGGRNFEGCKIVNTGGSIDKPLLATGPDPTVPGRQNVYIAQSGHSSARIDVWRSTDGGSTFITGGATGGAGGFAQPAVGPNGELYVSWSTIGGQVRIARSFDRGASFSPHVLVATSVVRNRRSITAQPDRGVFTGSSMDVDRSGGAFNGRIYLVHTDFGAGGGDNIDVFVNHSSDQGQTWSARQRVNDDGAAGSQFLPWLDVDQKTGLVSVLWYDTRRDPGHRRADVFAAFSSDGGVSFASNVRVSDGQSRSDLDPSQFQSAFQTCVSDPGFNCTSDPNYLEYIGIAAHACRAFAVWSDNSATFDLDYVSDLVAATRCAGVRNTAYLLGDRDDFTPGDGVDVVPLSTSALELLEFLQPAPGQSPQADLDAPGVNRSVGLTHYLGLPEGALLTSARVRVRLLGAEFIKNDVVFYNQTAVPAPGQLPLPLIAMRDVLGSEPQPGQPFELELDLAKIPIRLEDNSGGAGGSWTGPPDDIVNLLPVLNLDRRLDLIVADDATVDFSELRITYVLATDPRGDVNGDAKVNLEDLSVVLDALRTDGYPGDPRDLDADGKVTVLDLRQMVLLCDQPGCR